MVPVCFCLSSAQLDSITYIFASALDSKVTLLLFKCLICLHLYRFEGGFGGKSGIQKYPTLSSVNNTFSLSTTKHWMDLVLAALDSYTWCFGQRLLTPGSIFSGNGAKVTFIFRTIWETP